MWDNTLFLICPITCCGPTKHVDHNRGRFAQHLRGGSNIILKSNETNTISKDVLRDVRYLWLINCTT